MLTPTLHHGIVVLVILVSALVVARASYRLGYRRAVRENDALLDCLSKDSGFGRTVWQRMVVEAVQQKMLEPQALVTSQIHVFNRLAKDDQRLITAAARATFSILRSDYVKTAAARSAAPTEAP